MCIVRHGSHTKHKRDLLSRDEMKYNVKLTPTHPQVHIRDHSQGAEIGRGVFLFLFGEGERELLDVEGERWRKSGREQGRKKESERESE